MGKISFVFFIIIILAVNLSVALSETMESKKPKFKNYESMTVSNGEGTEEINNDLGDDEIHALEGFAKEEREYGKFESITRDGKKFRKGKKINKKYIDFSYQQKAPPIQLDVAQAPKSKFTKE